MVETSIPISAYTFVVKRRHLLGFLVSILEQAKVPTRKKLSLTLEARITKKNILCHYNLLRCPYEFFRTFTFK